MEQLETFFSLSEQTRFFLLSCLYGIPLGILFDMFRVIRAILPHNKILVAIEDILFLFLYAVFIVTFSIVYSRSEFRVYYIIGNLLGFTIYFLTIGTVVIGVIRKSMGYIKRVLKFFISPIIKVIKKIYFFIVNNFKLKCKINKNSSEINEIDLIDNVDLLYNNAKVE